MKIAQKILNLVEEYPDTSYLVRLLVVPAHEFFYLYSSISPSLARLGEYYLEENDDFVDDLIGDLQRGDSFESWWSKVFEDEAIREATISALHEDGQLLDFLNYVGKSSPKDLQDAGPRELIGFIRDVNLEWGLEGALKPVLSRLLRPSLTQFLKRTLSEGVESSIGTCRVFLTDEKDCEVFISKEDMPENSRLMQKIQTHPEFVEKVFDGRLWSKKFGGSVDPFKSSVRRLFDVDVTALPGFSDELSREIKHSATFDPWEVERRKKRQ